MHARYGAILWDVPDENLSQADQSIVANAAQKLHITLIAIGDRVRQSAIQQLLGIRYKSNHMNTAHPAITTLSSVLRGLPSGLRQQEPDAAAMRRVQVDAVEVRVLAEAGGVPQVTEREIAEDTRAIWIGGDIDQMLLYRADSSGAPPMLRLAGHNVAAMTQKLEGSPTAKRSSR